MGIYLNPDNEKFFQAVNSDIYVDKTGLIGYTNQKLRTLGKYICVSRPRRFGKFNSYWNQTETFEALRMYIDMNFEGLKDDVLRMIAGESVPVNTGSFTNDMVTFHTEDDVLTLLVHLGYLGYDFEHKCVFIPKKKFPEKPALVVELKWDKTAEGAITKIKKKQYCQSLEDYRGNLLLVGINYDKETREHTCVIEEYEK